MKRESRLQGRRTLVGSAVLIACAVLLLGSPVLAQGPSYKIGVTFPLTGIAAAEGTSATDAVKLAVKQINDSGFLTNGGKLEASFYDSQAKPDVGVRALQQAITVGNVPFILTGYSSVSAAQAPVAARNQRVLVNVGGASPALSSLSPWFFNAIPLTNLQVPVLIEYLSKHTNDKNFALIYRDDDLGKGIKSVFAPAVKAYGGTVVGEESYLPGTNDFRLQLTRLRADKPDVVYIGGVATEIGAIIHQAATLGLRPLWTSYGAYNHASTIKLGGSDAEGGTYTNPSYFQKDLKPYPAYNSFKTAWLGEYGNTDKLDYVASQFYLGTYLYAEAINKVLAAGKSVTTENLRDTIATSKFDTIAGTLYFNKDHNGIASIGIFKLTNGKFEAVQVYPPSEVGAALDKVTQ